MTNDVETTSIVNGGLRDETGIKVWKEGLPMLLDLYDKYGVKATFFYIANFAKQKRQRYPKQKTTVPTEIKNWILHSEHFDYFFNDKE